MSADLTPRYRQWCDTTGSAPNGATISACKQYRYALWRSWDHGVRLVFVMLNPSTADAALDDPTIRRCVGFAKREGYGGLMVVNLYGYRATSPKALLTCADPIGPDNNDYLTGALNGSKGRPVVAAWGANADRDPDRVSAVLDLVPGVDWRCLGHSKSGAPKHPLYVKGDQPLIALRATDKSDHTGRRADGSWECTEDHRTEPCGRCLPCQRIEQEKSR